MRLLFRSSPTLLEVVAEEIKTSTAANMRHPGLVVVKREAASDQLLAQPGECRVGLLLGFALDDQVVGVASNLVALAHQHRIDSVKVHIRWMRRRHPGKGLSWLQKRYFRSSGGRRWVITAPTWSADGSTSYSDLFQASGLPIRRHVKVQAAATAFDPAFRDYFRQLRKSRSRATATERAGSYAPTDHPLVLGGLGRLSRASGRRSALASSRSRASERTLAPAVVAHREHASTRDFLVAL
ncbi:hypothetical protein WME73_37155 [Sorangium sp. So ce302]